jgi:hypothetical protein
MSVDLPTIIAAARTAIAAREFRLGDFDGYCAARAPYGDMSTAETMLPLLLELQEYRDMALKAAA